jgi:16S rRNA (guanine966-N2)-methyltransferase
MMRPTPRKPHRDAARPTSGRVRTALFDRIAPVLEGAIVLDLFAGTGGLGIEALQRGARQAVFVEQDTRLCRVIREALRREGLAAAAEVRCQDALAAIGHLGRASARFDVVLLDPPYGRGWIERTLDALARAGIVRSRGMIVAEGHWRDRPATEAPVVIERETRYGETALWYIRIGGEE